jgi:hypothetical protein
MQALTLSRSRPTDSRFSTTATESGYLVYFEVLQVACLTETHIEWKVKPDLVLEKHVCRLHDWLFAERPLEWRVDAERWEIRLGGTLIWQLPREPWCVQGEFDGRYIGFSSTTEGCSLSGPFPFARPNSISQLWPDGKQHRRRNMPLVEANLKERVILLREAEGSPVRRLTDARLVCPLLRAVALPQFQQCCDWLEQHWPVGTDAAATL